MSPRRYKQRTDVHEERITKGKETTLADCAGGWKQSIADPPQEQQVDTGRGSMKMDLT